MEKLGHYLQGLRQDKKLSVRQVEQLSKQLYPKDKKRQISHTYLLKIEGSEYQAPSPFKLKSLATIYELDFYFLMELAGYLYSEDDDEDQILRQLRDHISKTGINADYFIKALLDLGKESMALINRTISMMATQERQITRQEIDVENKV